MGKKSIDIQFINSQKDNFLQYLCESIDIEAKFFLDEISKISEIYVFSGVIRNYFINHKGKIRDLDIVFKTSNIHELSLLLDNYSFKINSFGGYKIEIGSLNIDFWDIDKTWGLNNSNLYLDLDKQYFLPETSFFNFSSVIFDYQKRDFIVSKEFVKFLKKRELDYVLEDNPLPILCLVNILFYSIKYNLTISKRLKKYFIKNFNKYSESDFNNIQLKHFKEIIYSYEVLRAYNYIFKNKLQ